MVRSDGVWVSPFPESTPTRGEAFSGQASRGQTTPYGTAESGVARSPNYLVNRDLAKTLRVIAGEGWSGFYEGPVAKMFADYSASQGGIITEADLKSIQAEVVDPVKVNIPRRGRLSGRADDPNDVNALVPGKRTRQTINPQLAMKDGKPWMVFGTPGGDTQPRSQLQFFLNHFEFGMGVQQALEQPVVISRSFRSSSHPHGVSGTLQTPSSLPEATKEGLAARGHDLDIRPVRGVGAVKAIVINQETGALMGGVSPTRESYAVGW